MSIHSSSTVFLCRITGSWSQSQLSTGEGVVQPEQTSTSKSQGHIETYNHSHSHSYLWSTEHVWPEVTRENSRSHGVNMQTPYNQWSSWSILLTFAMCEKRRMHIKNIHADLSLGHKKPLQGPWVEPWARQGTHLCYTVKQMYQTFIKKKWEGKNILF